MFLIRNAKLLTEGKIVEGDILIENEFIKEIAEKISPKSSDCVIIDAEGSYVMPEQLMIKCISERARTYS